jgi:hypothetical protein
MFPLTTDTVRFGYLRDPLFVACLLVYFVNRWVLKAFWETGFFHEHLNDLICIPFWVPIMLWGQRRFGLRESDGPPLAGETMIPLFVWSWLFEIVIPRSGVLGERAVSDYMDIFYYSLGALLACAFWTWWYRAPPGSDGACASGSVGSGQSPETIRLGSC